MLRKLNGQTEEQANECNTKGRKGATFGAFLEFSRNQGDSENSRVEPTVSPYDRWYK
jgi:hypothetical protein